jgi:hypothetical protein
LSDRLALLLVLTVRLAPRAPGEKQEQQAGGDQHQLGRHVAVERGANADGKQVEHQEGAEHAGHHRAHRVAVRQRHGHQLGLVTELGEEQQHEGRRDRGEVHAQPA